MPRRRTWIVAGIALIALVLGWRSRPDADPAWTVAVRASKTELAPWQSAQLEAIVTPAPPPGWSFAWEDDVGAVRGDHATARFRTGALGEHAVRVVVRSPAGDERRAEAVVRVTAIAYVGSQAAPAQAPARPDLDFGFADIEVEKDTICRGEPTRIRIAAHRDGGGEGWLVPSVGGVLGWDVPYTRLAGAPGTYRVPVRLVDPQGGDAAHVDDSVFITLEDCVAPWVVLVRSRRYHTDEDRGFELSASLRDGPVWHAWSEQTHAAPGAGPAPVSPVVAAAAWRWEFGDGTQATTRLPFVRHEFPAEEDRAADGVIDSYVVRVIALDAQGQELGVGVETVALVNRTAELKRLDGRLQLKTIHAAVPALGPRGERVLDVVLRNVDREETATIETMSLRLVTCEEQDGGVRAADVAPVFADRVVAPGGEVTGRMTWPAGQADICFVNATVTGRSSPGNYEVVGYFSLEVGRSKSTKTVADPARVAALRQVSRALGDPRIPITADVIRRLEDEGKIPRGLLDAPAM